MLTRAGRIALGSVRCRLRVVLRMGLCVWKACRVGLTRTRGWCEGLTVGVRRMREGPVRRREWRRIIRGWLRLGVPGNSLRCRVACWISRRKCLSHLRICSVPELRILTRLLTRILPRLLTRILTRLLTRILT